MNDIKTLCHSIPVPPHWTPEQTHDMLDFFESIVLTLWEHHSSALREQFSCDKCTEARQSDQLDFPF